MRKLDKLKRTNFIRELYRLLINNGRCYAAFTNDDLELLTHLQSKNLVLDPMAGYGLLTRKCAEIGLNSYSLELNVPLYLWQLLCHPQNGSNFIDCANWLLKKKLSWPNLNTAGIFSDEYFPEELWLLVLQLKDLIDLAVKENFQNVNDTDELTLALLVPFAGRLSCYTKGDNPTHVKQGGLCIINGRKSDERNYGWENDFEDYLNMLIYRLKTDLDKTVVFDHILKNGDARVFGFPRQTFDGMLTSPPYPNFRDFISFFKVEQAFLQKIGFKNNQDFRYTKKDIIGSNSVSGRKSLSPKSKVVQQFFNNINNLDLKGKTKKDEENYYIPYFTNYFSDLELAYENVSRSIGEDFEGYIIVVNNTHRNLIVPVSEFIVETWRELGFKVDVWKSSEQFHFGTKNPRARGFKAKHTKHTIRIKST